MDSSRPTSRLREGPLDVTAFLADDSATDCGALAVFAGTVRNRHEGRAVTGIHYHAYAPLAERRLLEVEEETQRRFGVRCTVAHAVGELKVGDVSVIILARAPHRPEAFAAARYAIDTIKATVPIWKEERYADGGSGFVEGTPLKEIDSA